jgi:ABC-2 type transport system ATP-binding protein
MNSDPIIEVADLSKVFQIARNKPVSIKERLLRSNKSSLSSFVALDRVSLRVRHGEAIGVVGHNGSGKSTLMKCISGIMYPTFGSVSVSGRVVPLLELGAGFQADLSARENIYMNAAILGLSKSQTNAVFESIVDFSGLQEFLEMPVRHYSSGMYARLGFSIAVHVRPEVMIFDEVLAVGDEVFQAKCLRRISEMVSGGTTMILVTHSVAQVRSVCSRGIVLSHGRLVFDGDPDDCADFYQNMSTDPQVG